MKTIFATIILMPFLAFAHGTAIEMVEQSTTEVLKKFSTEEDKNIVEAFSAVKSWTSCNLVKVKVYYNANANSIEYSCEMMHHNGQEMLMCDKQ